MLEAINRFFRNQMAPAGSVPQDDGHRLQVATCALLLEIAHADDEFSTEEQETVVNLVRREFQLTTQETTDLIALAEIERHQSTDLYQFTRLIAEQYSRAQKLTVLESLWRVVYSDGRLEAHEDHLIHKLAKLLGLQHTELIAVKLKIKPDQGPEQ